MTRLRRHTEKAKAIISRSLSSTTARQPLVGGVCVWDKAYDASNSANQGLGQGCRHYETLNFHVSWLWGSVVGGTELKFWCVNCYLKPGFCNLSSWKVRGGVCEEMAKPENWPFWSLCSDWKQLFSKGHGLLTDVSSKKNSYRDVWVKI